MRLCKAKNSGSSLITPRRAPTHSGMHDGSFIFSMRTAAGRPDLYAVRADKLLLEVAMRRELGVSAVVAQRDIWTDLEPMARLQRVLDGQGFEEIERIPVVTNMPQEDRELHFYRIVGEVQPRPPSLRIDLPIIGQRIEAEMQ